MVNGRNEKYEGMEGHEEGEYHFSDDEVNYDAEAEEAPKSVEQPPRDIKQTVIANVNRYRRMIIGLVVFFVLIFIVYKFLSPTPTTTVADFNQAQNAPKPIERVTPKPVETVPAPAAPTPSQPAPTYAQQPNPQPMQAAPQQQPAMMPVAQQSSMPAQNAMMPQQQTGMPPQQPMAPQQAMPAQMMPAQQAQMMSPQAMPIPMPPTAEMAAQKNVMDRVAAVEEDNAKVMNVLQSQLAQKMADYEAQNNATQERMMMLNKRLANMEASLNKMAQLLRDATANKAPVMVTAPPPPPPPPVRVSVPKIIYTVQAIIPGRAWLKSDMGDTVTVAEGDVLKDYGRVTKIDPYDGIVDIDTGNKIITLSYGSGVD